jgi:hypothetical protein
VALRKKLSRIFSPPMPHEKMFTITAPWLNMRPRYVSIVGSPGMVVGDTFVPSAEIQPGDPCFSNTAYTSLNVLPSG